MSAISIVASALLALAAGSSVTISSTTGFSVMASSAARGAGDARRQDDRVDDMNGVHSKVNVGGDDVGVIDHRTGVAQGEFDSFALCGCCFHAIASDRWRLLCPALCDRAAPGSADLADWPMRNRQRFGRQLGKRFARRRQ